MRSKPHVIQIGFNKTGTSSLGKLFKRNNYKVGSVKFAKIIQVNITNKVPPFTGLEHIDLFQDVENHKKGIYIYENFECLYNNYPNAYFILTTRSCESWIKSRMRHKKGNYARIALENKNLNTLEELRDAWRNEFYDYHLRVNSFFQDKSNFFTLSLENINFKALKNFLKKDYFFSQNNYPKVLTGMSEPPENIPLPDTMSFIERNYN